MYQADFSPSPMPQCRLAHRDKSIEITISKANIDDTQILSRHFRT